MDTATKGRQLCDTFVLTIILCLAVNNGYAQGTNVSKSLRIVTIVEPPYVIQDKKTDKFSGLLIDVLAEAGITLDHVSTPIHTAYGFEEDPGQFNGALGDLANGKYDLAVAPFSIRSPRAKVVTFSQPVIHHGYMVLYKIPKDPKWTVTSTAPRTLLEPFSPGLWSLTILMCIITSAALYCIRRFSPYEEGQTPDGSFSLGLMHVVGSISFRNIMPTPRSISGRTLTAFWWVFSVFAVSAYVAALVVVLLRVNPHIRTLPFGSVEEMVAGTDVTILGVKNSATYNYFENHKGMSERLIYDYWKNNWDTAIVDTLPEALKKMEEGAGKFAVFMDEALAEHLANREPCDKVVIGDPVGDQTIGFACRQGSSLCDDLNHHILRLQEQGKMESLRAKWFWSHCRKSSEMFFEGEAFLDTFGGKEPGLLSPHSLTIKRFSAAFIVVAVGVTLALVLLVVEILYARRSGNIHRRLKMSSRQDDTRGIQDHDFDARPDA